MLSVERIAAVKREGRVDLVLGDLTPEPYAKTGAALLPALRA
jgi:hypothetical protein